MKNDDVIKDYVKGYSKAKTKHVFIDGRAIYSYGYHFPIAFKLVDGWIINKTKYSQSTTRHQNILLSEIETQRLPIIQTTTEKLKDIIQQKPTFVSELVLGEL